MSTEKKIIFGGIFFTIILVGSALFWLPKDKPDGLPEDQVITRTGLHWHPKLTIYLSSQKQTLPEGIGLEGPVHNPIHTHEDASEDIVHMEMEGLVTKDDTKLSEFFKAWGKDFNSGKILDKVATAEGQIKMSVNGIENKEFENYLMKDGDKIEIKYE